MSDKPDREELRRRLREKTRRAKRGDDVAPSTSRRPRDVDVERMLVQQGIDDPEILKMASVVARDPNRAKTMLKEALENIESKPASDDEDLPPAPSTVYDSDDEDVPPA